MIFLLSCGKDGAVKSSRRKQDPSKYFSAQTLKVNVYYEPGAAPYTGDGPLLKYWSLLELNLKALFEGRSSPPSISVPKELSQMQELPHQNKDLWSTDEVMELSKKTALSSHPTHFHLFFLRGRAKEGENIIGFHISGTQTIAIFKEVIQGMGNDALNVVAKYVEQATIIHEMGHALGLVNNGLPMVTKHQDKDHGAHCSNPDCVMYYSNEGAQDLLSFIQRFPTSGSFVMFDSQCLQDTRSY